jgi:hypothetical protein
VAPSDAPSAGAPNVAHPIDTTRFHTAPCSVLSPVQLQQLNVAAPGQVVSSPAGPDCTWIDRNGPSKMTLGVIFSTSSHGLKDIYSHKEDFKYFQQWPDIEGYPAVSALPIDRHTQGDCTVSVGVSNDLFVDVEAQLTGGANAPSDYTDPCPRALKAATAVVQTLKGGS